MQRSAKYVQGLFLFFVMVLTVIVSQFVRAETDAGTATSSLPNWNDTISLTSGSVEALGPIVAAAPGNNSVMVAYSLEKSATNHDPYYRKSTEFGKSGTWSSAQPIFESTKDSLGINIAYDSQNRANAAWVEDLSHLYFARETSSGLSWVVQADIENHTALDVATPRIFTSGSKTIDIVWRQRNADGFPSSISGDIYHVRTTDPDLTNQWRGHTNPIEAVTADAFNPDLFVQGNTIHVVWEELWSTNPYDKRVVYTVGTDDGFNVTWSNPIEISRLPQDSNPPDTANVPRITVSDDTIHVTFTEKVLNGPTSPDRDHQYVHHVSCPLAKDCTQESNWDIDGVISGQRVAANNSSPDVVQSTIDVSSKCLYVYYHGVEYPKTGAENELVWGVSNCGTVSWGASSKLIDTSDQVLRPDLFVKNDAWTFLVYEQIDGFGNSQVQFMYDQPIIYLPLVVKN